ncbi:hypothetical protein EPD60_06830 [Flaviaesturariibacter flavus]|uniref:Uncharacterized protein n=1 Tax=Flaviaesturariibacter flavus TaxID=2502780 RepID=A0A4R1BIM5_9BACT|nr:hypothetical protein [Flaviaesturariibacter flavus]TCJ17018.1 hypothetical protein EPD60_06830 [Flaviaesturariibacter flavus]
MRQLLFIIMFSATGLIAAAQNADSVQAWKSLPEVVVPNCTDWKNANLGVTKARWNYYLGLYANVFGILWKTYVPNSTGKSAWLQSLTFFVEGIHRNQHTDAPIRLHFYVANDSGRTGALLTFRSGDALGKPAAHGSGGRARGTSMC